MKGSFKVVFSVLLIVAGFALAPAYGGMMETKTSGMLAGIGSHNAAGEVSITKDMKGNPILAMKDMKVDKVPDGRVYLAKDGDHTKGVELGKLKQFSGTVQFPIPAGVMTHDYNSVVIWCKKFDVGIGQASFKKETMGKKEMMEENKMMK